MNRRVATVLICTFLGMVVATVWLPVHAERSDVLYATGAIAKFTLHRYEWIWDYWQAKDWTHRGSFGETVLVTRIAWFRWALQLGSVVSIGGLLALFFRTRAARLPADP